MASGKVGLTDLTHSTAFSILDSLVTQGRLDQDKYGQAKHSLGAQPCSPTRSLFWSASHENIVFESISQQKTALKGITVREQDAVAVLCVGSAV